jgi:hypothetical protein
MLLFPFVFRRNLACGTLYFSASCGAKGTSKRCRRAKYLFKKINNGHGAQVNKRIGGGVGTAALVVSARRLSGYRRISAAIAASVVLTLWSSGAMAASNACRGAGGTSAVTTTATPALLYVQCFQAILISGNPLQTFGGSCERTRRPPPIIWRIGQTSGSTSLTVKA